MTITPPPNVLFGTVRMRAADFAADTLNDPDVNPDAYSVTGEVTFTSTVNKVVDATATPDPVMLFNAPIVATVGPDGYLGILYSNDSFVEDVNLVASNNPDLNPTNFQYLVTYNLRGAGNRKLSIPQDRITVLAGETIQLPLATTTEATTPDSVATATAAAAIAEAAALAAAASAAAAEDAAEEAVAADLGVKAYGAIGNDTADDTAAIQSAIDAAPVGGSVFFPAGTYKVLSALSIPSYLTLTGVGKASRINYKGTGTMVTLTNKREVKFENLWITISDQATATLFDLSNSFRCDWRFCFLAGGFVGPASPGTVTGNIGIILRDNSGDNNLIETDVANFHVGLKTSCIQNGVNGGAFEYNNYSILGSGGGGISVNGYTDFVSAVGVTVSHVDTGNASGQWWFNNVWMEGADTTVKIGSGSSGPAQFGMTNAKLAGTTKVLDIQACRNPSFFNVELAGDSGGVATPDPVTINSSNASEGVMFADSVVTGKDLVTTAFPAGWMLHTRGGSTSVFKVPNRLDVPYGGVIRMQRPDLAYIDVLSQTSGTVTVLSAAGNNNTESLQFNNVTGTKVLALDTVSSSVNYIAGAQSATGNPVKLEARGTDTDIHLRLTPKGAGGVEIGASGPRLYPVTGTPEGAVTAPVGSVALRKDGSTSTSLYVKESGTGNTGWVPFMGGAAVTAAISAAIAALVDSSPGTLDTLKELADALGDDPNFATTMTNALALKAPLASPALTGNPTAPTQSAGDNSTKVATTAYADAKVLDSIADADTTHAPSRNAVFDALALKADDSAVIHNSLADAKGDLIVATADNTVARKAVGSDGAQLVADPAQSDGLRWTTSKRFEGSGDPEGVVTASVGSTYTDTTNGWQYEKQTGTGNTGWLGIGQALPRFAFASGTYLFPIIPTNTAATANDTLRLTAWYCPQPLTITRIGAEISSAGVAGSKLRIGIYSDSGAGVPGNLLLDAGQINGDSATVQEITLGASQIIPRGWVWLGGAIQSAPTSPPQWRTVSIPQMVGGMLLGRGTSIPSSGSSGSVYSYSGISGALPSTLSSPSTGSDAPRLFFKLA